ncbi:MAG: hypothetical protein V3R81_15525 [Gammaproteobacteria bacterium]
MRPFVLALLLVFAMPSMAQQAELTLMGRTATELKATLGDPSLIWPEHPAYTWQYADDLCVLQLYLYAPTVGGEAVVKYAEASMRGVGEMVMSSNQVQTCLVSRGQIPSP